MISVGVRDLKNQLSQYLQQVKLGERVLVTDHNRVIAEISLPRENQANLGLEAALEEMVASGKLQKAQRSASLATSSPVGTLDWISVYKDNRSDR
jgi:antitoxin (DNA-binding transcriptional repressor) of toxin-antitoxin stability system